MATTKTRKPAARKRTVRKKKKPSRFPGQIRISRILLFLALFAFLFVSIAAAGYVIFFRVVIASADHDPGCRSVASIVGTGASLCKAVEPLPNHGADSMQKLYSGAA